MGNLISKRSRSSIHTEIEPDRETNKKRRRIEGSSGNYLPEELQEQILIRLPVKSLLRFKSVCKTWRSVFESRPFIDSHTRRHRHDYSDSLIYSPYAATRKALTREPLPDPIKAAPGPLDLRLPRTMTRLGLLRPDSGSVTEWKRAVHVLGPLSNGIYCIITDLRNNRALSIPTARIALCNPATHDFRFLDPYPSHSVLPYLGTMHCRVHYGFGSTADCSDYKVVVVISWGRRFSSFLSFVYSLKRGAWTKIVDYKYRERHYGDEKAIEGLLVEQVGYPEITGDASLSRQAFFNGCWHWMVALGVERSTAIMSFDCTRDAFGLMAPPLPYDYDHPRTTDYVKGGQVFALEDHLAALYFHSDIHVWVLMEYCDPESWTQIYAIQPDFYGGFRTLVGISWEGDSDGVGDGVGIQTIFFEDSSGHLISCDSYGYKDHGNHAISSHIWWNTPGISTYMQTLEPLVN